MVAFSSNNRRILIIGAGPTGLAASLELARLGVQCEIVERRSQPSELSRAVGIMPVTMAHLEPFGVAESIGHEAISIRKIGIYRDQKPLMSLDFSESQRDLDFMRALPQNRTEELIREGLNRSGVDVRYGCEVTSISNTPEKVEVEFDKQRHESYDWVIAADGVNSRTRECLGIDYPGFDIPGQWSIADVDVDGYDCERVTVGVQMPPGDFSIIIPIERNRVRIASSAPDALSMLPHPLDITHIRRQAMFSISVRQAETYQVGRVLLAGDAAHCHSPVGGRGMNLGIDDAIHAARAIVNDKTTEYSGARHPIGQRVMNQSEQGRKVVCSDSRITQMMTRLVTKTIQHVPPLQRKVLKVMTTLG